MKNPELFIACAVASFIPWGLVFKFVGLEAQIVGLVVQLIGLSVIVIKRKDIF